MNRHITYQLKLSHRNIAVAELILDIQRVAKKCKLPTLTQAVYRKHGRFNPLTLSSRFGSWNRTLVRAGLAPSRHFRVAAEVVLEDVRRVAGELKRDRLLLSDYEKAGRYSMTLVYRHFGSWSGVLAAGGLGPSSYRPRTSDGALMRNLENLWQKLGRQPKCADLVSPLSPLGLTPYQRRFGGFENALIAFVAWKKNSGQVPVGGMGRKRHQSTRSINWRTRYLVLRRDQFRCRACGRSPASEPGVRLQIDHIKPWGSGGETVIENLQTLCQRCNVGKSDL